MLILYFLILIYNFQSLIYNCFTIKYRYFNSFKYNNLVFLLIKRFLLSYNYLIKLKKLKLMSWPKMIQISIFKETRFNITTGIKTNLILKISCEIKYVNSSDISCRTCSKIIHDRKRTYEDQETTSKIARNDVEKRNKTWNHQVSLFVNFREQNDK